MTDSAAPTRPRQVTLAASLIMLGSVAVVLAVFQRISELQSLETKAAVERFLAAPPGSDLGLGVQGVLDALHLIAMVAGGCAAAAAILGYQVLQRSRGARLGLSVLALPLFVSGLATGGFMSSIVVASAVMLWFQPARDWFNGIAREAGPRRPDPTVQRSSPPAPAAPSSTDPSSQPTPPSGPPSGPSSVPVERPPEAGPRAVPGFGAVGPDAQVVIGPQQASGGRGAARPGAVTLACLVTWAFASLAVLVVASSLIVLATNPDLIFDEVRKNPDLADQGISDQLLVRATYVTGGLMILWALVAMLLAALTFRRQGWARLPLVVSSAVCAGLCFLGTFGQVLMAIPLMGSIVAFGLLLRPDVRAWFTRS